MKTYHSKKALRRGDRARDRRGGRARFCTFDPERFSKLLDAEVAPTDFLTRRFFRTIANLVNL